MSSQSVFFSSLQERLIEFGRTSPEAHEVFAKLSPEARVAALLAVERHLASALEKGAADKTPGHKSAGKKAATATNPECAIASCNATHNASHFARLFPEDKRVHASQAGSLFGRHVH